VSIPVYLPTSKRFSIGAAGVANRWTVRLAVTWIVLLLGLEILIRSGADTGLFLPAPSVVLKALGEMIVDGTLATNLAATFARIAGGLFLGVLIGVSLGLAVGTSARLRHIVDPIVAAIHPIPRLAFFPLLIVVFGIGETSKIAAVSLGAFFPMFLNTVAGVRAMSPTHLDLGRNYGADRRQVFRHVLLPGAMPLMLTGLRLSANTAFHGTIGVEMVASGTGLGAMLWMSWQTFRIDNLYAILVVIAAIGIGLVTAIRWISIRAAPWLVEKPTIV
jgi:NitT/TauT family transport system permease protein